MKTMTCKQLGGACDEAFTASTFEEIAELSKEHGMDMIQHGEPEHMAVMDKMMDLMKDPIAMAEWFEQRKKEFESLPED